LITTPVPTLPKPKKTEKAAERDARKVEEAKSGWRHEDWYFVQKMNKLNRYGYLVFRFCFENQDFPSIVGQVAKKVPMNKEIPKVSEEEEDIVTESPGK